MYLRSPNSTSLTLKVSRSDSGNIWGLWGWNPGGIWCHHLWHHILWFHFQIKGQVMLLLVRWTKISPFPMVPFSGTPANPSLPLKSEMLVSLRNVCLRPSRALCIVPSNKLSDCRIGCSNMNTWSCLLLNQTLGSSRSVTVNSDWQQGSRVSGWNISHHILLLLSTGDNREWTWFLPLLLLRHRSSVDVTFLTCLTPTNNWAAVFCPNRSIHNTLSWSASPH